MFIPPEFQGLFIGSKDLGPWILGLTLLYSLALACTFFVPRSKSSRWSVVACAALMPLLSGQVGLLSVFLTGQAIIFAVRIASFAELTQKQSWGRSSYFFWLLNPVYRGPSPAGFPLRQTCLEGSRYLAYALLGFGAWWGVCVARAAMLAQPSTWQGAPLLSYFIFSGILISYFALLLEFLSLFLQAVSRLLGAQVEAVFKAPLLSTSVREFWGRRWNRFISRFALTKIALPLKRRSRMLQLFAVFGASGLFHEYFVMGTTHLWTTLGPMSAFFLIQALFVLLEGRLHEFLAKRKLLAHHEWLGARIGHLSTLLWMLSCSPLFFWPLRPLLIELGYPGAALLPVFSVWQSLWPL